MWRWTFALMASSSAAGSEQAHQRGDPLPLHGIVDVSLFLPALDEPGPAQDIEMMGQGRPRDLDGLLDLADGHLSARLHQEEEDLQPAEVREGLEGLDVALVGLQLPEGQPGDGFHDSKYMELSSRLSSVGS